MSEGRILRHRRSAASALALAAAALALAAPPGAGAQEGAAFRPAERGRRLVFPRDHFAHLDSRLEWWYVTAIVEEEGAGRPTHGLQFTVFRLGIRPGRPEGRSAWRANHVLLGHAALTDLARGVHRFSETLCRAAPLLARIGAPGEEVVVSMPAPAGRRGRFALLCAGGRFEVEAVAEDFSFSLALAPTRPPLLHGDQGFSPKDPEGRTASHYASHTRLRVEGTLAVGGRSRRVTGWAWFDHEFGDGRLAPGQVGWDWAGLRLEDGSDLMVYRMHRADGRTAFLAGTRRRADGTVETLDAGDLEVAPIGEKDGHPRALRLVLEGEEFLVEPIVVGCVNESRLLPDLRYLEALARVLREGRVVGEGYLECAGYGGARVALPDR